MTPEITRSSEVQMKKYRADIKGKSEMIYDRRQENLRDRFLPRHLPPHVS